MSKDLKDIIDALKNEEDDLKKAFNWFKEKEETDFKTNITYNGLEGIITQNDLTSTSWNIGANSGSIESNMSILIDSWGDESRFRMMYPIAEWVRLDSLIRNLGVTIHSPFQPWELIAVSFILCYMNGFSLIYPWGNFVLVRSATKQVFRKQSLDRSEQEMTISVRLKSTVKRYAKDRTVLCLYPEERIIPTFSYNVSGSYFSSSIGKKFSKSWNQYCDEHQNYNWLCDGTIFKNKEGDLIAAGGDNIEDIAVVYEKDKIIISPGCEDGNLPGSTMVTFFLIGELNGYKVETRPISMTDIKKCDWGVVTEMATILKWDSIVDPKHKELIRVSKKHEYRFSQVFLKSYMKLKHGDSRLMDLPKIIERGEDWFPDEADRREYAFRGLQMKKQRWEPEGWKNISITPPEGEVSFKRRRLKIANLYGRYWNFPHESSQTKW